MSEQKPLTAEEIKKRHGDLRRRTQRLAAHKLRNLNRWELCGALNQEDVRDGDLEEVEAEMFRIIHYLERGRR